MSINAWPGPGGTRRLPCLRCSSKFTSEGRHNRLCPTCNEWARLRHEVATVLAGLPSA
jgi:hypothetical protein